MEMSLPSHLPAEVGALLHITNMILAFIPSSISGKVSLISWEAVSYNPQVGYLSQGYTNCCNKKMSKCVSSSEVEVSFSPIQ